MAEASLLKATAMQDQCALSLFTMPTRKGLTEQARRYIELRRTEEIECLERRMESERRAAELAKLEHERLLKERNYEAPRNRHGRAAATPTSPAITAAPPRVPEPAIANAAAGTYLSSRPNVNFSSCFLISYKLASNPECRPQWRPRPAMVLVVMRFPVMVLIVLPAMVVDLRWFCKSGTFLLVPVFCTCFRFCLPSSYFFAVLFSHSFPSLLSLFSINLFQFSSHILFQFPSYSLSFFFSFLSPESLTLFSSFAL